MTRLLTCLILTRPMGLSVRTKVDPLTFLPTTVTPKHVPEGVEEGDTVREERLWLRAQTTHPSTKGTYCRY